MTDRPKIWIRHEVRPSEHRAPLVPSDARRLVAQGLQVTVEESPWRAFPIAEYAEAGCRVAPAGSWTSAEDDYFILGLKELPESNEPLRHRHLFFGHAYKGQPGAAALLRRFVAGGGALLDLETLVDENGRRLAAFGYWAGYIGAALAVLLWRGTLKAPLEPTNRADLDAALRQTGPVPSALVIGALGRSGRGACDALEVAGAVPTRWDIAETASLDRPALVAHDLLVNCVFTTRPAPPFLTPDDLDSPLSVVCDVTCDVGSEHHLLPIYDRLTSWAEPVIRVHGGPRPTDVIAIDNLPSLLPVEASRDFSAQLSPLLPSLEGGAPWVRNLRTFHSHASEVTGD